MRSFTIFICVVFSSIQLTVQTNNRKFPADFTLGAANAAPQIEGAYLTDGKSLTIWDYFAHNQADKINDKSTPDVAADSYHKYEEDIKALKNVGFQMYRISIAWSRILPTADPTKINEAGVNYYKKLLKSLKDNNIQPLVTLYHWDLPQILQEKFGGWENETVADLFADYAKVCYKLFGDDVKWWITINEPKQVCNAGYGAGFYAPGIHSSGIAEYKCAKNVLLAHALAYRIYDTEFRESQKGKVSIVIDSLWYEPDSNKPEDLAASETSLQFNFGLYGNPVFKGDWPAIVKERVAHRSKLEGYKESRLPEFTEEEIGLIKGTHDYMAVNHYSSRMVNASTTEAPIGKPAFEKDVGVVEWINPNWPMSSDWFAVNPSGLRKFLVWLKKTYGDSQGIVITENGMSDKNGTLEDDHRIRYIRDYMSNTLDAIYEDKVNVTGYYLWSIIDDWEWTGGYQSFLGLYRVNFTSAEKERIPRKSASFFQKITSNRCLVEKCIN